MIPDAAVVAALRPFVRATRPVLHGLRESDPFGLRSRPAPVDGAERGRWEQVLDALAAVQVPGTAAWAAMDVRARSRWWVRRVGRFTTLVAAAPGFGGVLTRRLPVASVLGAAAQGMVLVAIAGEHGVRDEDELVALLGAVMFRRELAVRQASKADDAAADVRAAELTGDLERGRGPLVARIVGAVWRLGRALFEVEDELDKRPHGNLLTDGLSMLPVIGVAGKYLGEWSGLKKAARRAEERLAQPRWSGTR